MDSYLTEQQQIELLKKWWKEYGLAAVTGVVLAIALGFGWRFYQQYETVRSEAASLMYEHMVGDFFNNTTKDATQQANTLIKQYPKTPYAELASFALAAQAVQGQKWDEATQHLQWVIHHGKHRVFQDLAKIRLARVYLQQQKTKEALSELSSVKGKTFSALVFDVRGDVELQTGHQAQARTFYQKALDALPEDAANRPILEMKLNSLPSDASAS
ncbi:MAG: tetratricopeptide repeat protein [Gammaproteobacteria bacterium]|nr:tetratricopeptide repeat protein [Gammaproteobacteria bacterium]MBU1629188.1 tetratricopeptide repeat protein [Gammaproteobacteria bacterium]MBU1927354.1 tetratricopeptide repeat protein [Gammaproteobacteria bacterium]